jgi:transcription antitermination factor NusG
VGVSNFICAGDNPIKVPTDILKYLRSREDEDGFVKLGSSSSIHQGDHVRIIDGALGDHVAIVKELHGLNRVTLLLRLVGRQVSVNTSLERISAVS